MINVGIVGGTGYTGGELARLICNHSGMDLTAMTSRGNAGKPVSSVHGYLKGYVDLDFKSSIDGDEDVDLVFLATPHGVSMEHVPHLLDMGLKVVDLSGDYRLDDEAVYRKWYGKGHEDQDNLAKAVYGLPELFRDKISKAQLVANPGCYPTASILALAPLYAADLVDGDVIIDAKSGTSGAGINPTARTHHPNCGESVIAYNSGKHRHQPEIDLILHKRGGGGDVYFSPHLVPIIRGILASCYLDVKDEMTTGELQDLYSKFYSGERFVHVTEEGSIRDVVGSNHCQVAPVCMGGRKVAVFSSIDNLVKGASGQAVQCANIMCGLPEGMGIDFPGLGV